MSVLPFLHLVEKLKTTPRKGWINVGVQHPESIADHMYRMSVITMLCTDETLDKGKMQKIALVHDMAEAIVGDITPEDNVPKDEKQILELNAMKEICNNLLPPQYQLASGEIMSLFLEYENKSSPEARFVKDVDKFELVLQLFEYEKQRRVMEKLDNFASASALIQHPEVKGWCQEVLDQREQWWAANINKAHDE